MNEILTLFNDTYHLVLNDGSSEIAETNKTLMNISNFYILAHGTQTDKTLSYDLGFNIYFPWGYNELGWYTKEKSFENLFEVTVARDEGNDTGLTKPKYLNGDTSSYCKIFDLTLIANDMNEEFVKKSITRYYEDIKKAKMNHDEYSKYKNIGVVYIGTNKKGTLSGALEFIKNKMGKTTDDYSKKHLTEDSSQFESLLNGNKKYTYSTDMLYNKKRILSNIEVICMCCSVKEDDEHGGNIRALGYKNFGDF